MYCQLLGSEIKPSEKTIKPKWLVIMNNVEFARILSCDEQTGRITMNLREFAQLLSCGQRKWLLAYLLQLQFPDNKEKMTPKKLTNTKRWLLRQLPNNAAARLLNALAYCKDYSNFAFVELIDPDELLSLRHVGKKCVEEFIKLRGY